MIAVIDYIALCYTVIKEYFKLRIIVNWIYVND